MKAVCTLHEHGERDEVLSLKLCIWFEVKSYSPLKRDAGFLGNMLECWNAGMVSPNRNLAVARHFDVIFGRRLALHIINGCNVNLHQDTPSPKRQDIPAQPSVAHLRAESATPSTPQPETGPARHNIPNEHFVPQ